MHIYIISLPNARKRYARTVQELSAKMPGFRFCVPRMVDASTWSQEEFSKVYDEKLARQRFGRDLTRGEVACALSHQSAMCQFLDTGERACLIVEDDVLLSNYVGKFIRGLDGWFDKHQARPICVLLSEAAAVRYWSAVPWIGEIRRTRPIEAYGALAYLLNRKGAELILRANPMPLAMTSDNWCFYKRMGLKVLGVDKVLAGSYDFERLESSLEKERVLAGKQALLRREPPSRAERFASQLCGYVRCLWRICTGVNERGRFRSNAVVLEA